MSCGCKQTTAQALAATRAVIADLFAKGETRRAFFHRSGNCYHAAECGRLCPRLVKGFGVSQVYCYDIVTDVKTPLYPALEDPAFHCPMDQF